MKNLKKVQILAATSAVVGLLVTSPCKAGVVYQTNNTATSFITAVTDYSTTGSMMDGMTVTAFFNGSSTGTTAIWNNGSASTTDWTLSLLGDSYYSNWSFNFTQASLLTKLVFDGFDGLTVFDRKYMFIPDNAPTQQETEGEGTSGSKRGIDLIFTGTGASGINATATYTNPVALAGKAPVNDIWYSLTIDFGSNGIAQDFSFKQDTDNVVSRVPEPASLALLGIGLLGLGFSRRRKY